MHYVGKDIVHRGAALELDPTRLDASLAHSARKNVRKAQRVGFAIERRHGTAEELADLRRLWYFPEDPNFPEQLGERDVLYLAFLEGELVGGMILVPVGTHLFLNNLLADERGKAGQLQALLLWNAVHDLADSEFGYIDIGVSYRPNLQRFFQKWTSFDYPVIFNPPALLPRITMRPFQRLEEAPELADDARIRAFCQGRAFTLCPDREAALAVLEERGLAFSEVALPTPDSTDVELVDLTQLLPIAQGALLVGEEIEVTELWSRHGCYDFVKTEYLRRVLTAASDDWPNLCERRAASWKQLATLFDREDVEIEDGGPWPLSLALHVAGVTELEQRYTSFGVEARAADGVLHLPCHQELNETERGYLYAIYRGHLNLCSGWESTRVRGRLKLEVS